MADEPIRWDVIPLPPLLSEMNDDERAAWIAHVEAHTVPYREMSLEEIREAYGPPLDERGFTKRKFHTSPLPPKD